MLGIVGALICIVGFLLILTDNPYDEEKQEYQVAWVRIFGLALFVAGVAVLGQAEAGRG